jgi:hypothetical protein
MAMYKKSLHIKGRTAPHAARQINQFSQKEKGGAAATAAKTRESGAEVVPSAKAT